MDDDETLDQMIARLIADQLVQAGLSREVAIVLARAVTPPEDTVLIAQREDGVALGVTRSGRSRRGLPRGRRK